jgi:hypothetical protein
MKHGVSGSRDQPGAPATTLAVLDRLSRLEHGALRCGPSNHCRRRIAAATAGQTRVRRRGVGVVLSAVAAALVAAAGMFISAAVFQPIGHCPSGCSNQCLRSQP